MRAFLPALLFVGCFGLAHTAVEMPPLVVQGVLLTSHGAPWGGQLLTISLSDFYAQPETFEALSSAELDPKANGYKFCQVPTGPGGEFSCRLPGESRYIGLMPPLMCPGEDTLKSFVVGIRTPSGVILAIAVSGTKAEVRVPEGSDFRLVKPRDIPFTASATASRSAQADVLQLVLRATEPAV